MPYIRQSSTSTIVVANGKPLRIPTARAPDPTDPLPSSETLQNAAQPFVTENLFCWHWFSLLVRRCKPCKRGSYASRLVRYARQAQSHFYAAQRARQHEIVEAAEVP